MGQLRDAAAHGMAWLGGVAFVLSLACFVYSYFISFSDAAAIGSGSAALAADFALFTTFALHHSVLARSGAKRWIASVTGPRAERSMYVWVASILFIVVCVLWQPVPGVFYQHRGTLAGLHWTVVAAGAWLTLRAAAVLDPLELAGIRQIRGDLDPPRFRVVGPYKYLRHPIYLGWVLVVFGVPDPKYGEELCAWIQPHHGKAADAEEIRAFCKASLAHYKVPRYVKFVSEFPTTVSGKIQKFKMREQMCAELNLKEHETA